MTTQNQQNLQANSLYLIPKKNVHFQIPSLAKF